MSSKKSVLSRQSAWASKAGLALDSNGYLPTWQQNLFRPLSPTALAAFLNGSGNELQDSDGRAAKMSATHSSSALVVNVFDYWSETPDQVLHALGLDGNADSIAFEAQLPTGLSGNPPNLDMCVRRNDGRLVGVESKFTEWLSPKSDSKEHFKPKYFPSDHNAWGDLGLPATQALAEKVHSRALRFRYLDAPQLLKHALGLAKNSTAFELYYLYYEVDGPESAVHREEIQKFRAELGSDFEFHVTTYQDVFARLRSRATPSDAAYIEYLAARYFD